MSRRIARRAARAGCDAVLRLAPWLQPAIRSLARRGYLPPVVWRRLRPTRVWTLHAPDGTPFRYACGFAHDRLAPHVVWTDLKHWETSTQPVLYELARTARVFVDVGAYSGLYTVMACAANPRLRAVACEPNPVKIGQIVANVAVNGCADRVTVVERALAATRGTARLSLPSDDSQASLCAGGPGDRTVEVQTTTGDDLLRGLPVDLVKIDVEGFEPDVLAGMAGVLAACRPSVIAECLDQAALHRVRAVAARLGYGYVYHLDEPGPVRVGDGFAHPYRCPNYLFRVEPLPGHLG